MLPIFLTIQLIALIDVRFAGGGIRGAKGGINDAT